MKLSLATLAAFAPLAFAKYNIQIEYLKEIEDVAVKNAFDRAIERWEEVIVGNLETLTFTEAYSLQEPCGLPFNIRSGFKIDDLIIVADIKAIDGPGGTLGAAGPCVFDGDAMPRLGIMNFDLGDLETMKNDGSLDSVILHEMGHVLGMGTLWRKTTDNVPDKIKLNDNYEYVGTNGIRGHAQINGVGLPLIENTGGQGTKGGHWRESTYQNELMTGYLSGSAQPMSKMTVEALKDLGYQVNSNAADPFTVPNQGDAKGDDYLGTITNDMLIFDKRMILTPEGKLVTEDQFNADEQAGNSSEPSLSTPQIVMYLGVGFAAACAVFLVGAVAYSRRSNGAASEETREDKIVAMEAQTPEMMPEL